MAIVVPIVSQYDPKGVRAAEKSLGGVSGQASKASKGVGKLRGAMGAIGGALAVQKVGAFFGDIVSEARESAKVGRVTEQVIRSTGGAAGVSAGQVGRLATSISNMTGVDDEAIQGGQNLLLTFTNLHNGVGKGNDIFDQATRTMVDMSAALGQDTKASAIQLGKALNDPIRGVTALRRVGVSFTASQQDQIKTLVKSGNTMGAQKLILAELAKEFGGTARAASDPAQRAQVAWGNFKEQLGTAFLPILDKLLTAFSDRLLPALMGVADWLGRNQGAFLVLMTTIGGMATVLGGYVVGMKAVTAATNIAKVATQAWGLVMKANPVGLIITAIALLVAGLVMAYQKSETFRNIVQGAFNAVKTAAGAVAGFVSSVWRASIGAITAAWGGLRGFVTGVFSGIRSVATTIGQTISRLWTSVTVTITAAWYKFRAVATGIFTAIRNVVMGVVNAITGGFRRAWDAVKRVVDAIGGALKRIPILGSLLGDGQSWTMPPVLSPATMLTAGGGGSTTYNVTVTGAIDRDGTARELRALLADADRRQGRSRPARVRAW